jgi:glycosyltransferase involved in cell wall biosynthesis
VNVLLVGHERGSEETERHVRLLGGGLAEAGHRVAFAVKGDSWLARDCRRSGLVCHQVPMGSGIDGRTYSRLIKIACRDEIEVLHGHTRLGSIYTGLIARLTGKTSVATAHTLDVRPVVRLHHAILAVSHAVRDSLLSNGVPEKKISVVYKGVPDVPPESPERREVARERLGLRESDVAIAVSPCTASRREQCLFAGAAAALRHRVANVRFFLVDPSESTNHRRSEVDDVTHGKRPGRVGFFEGRRIPPSLFGAMDIYTELGQREDVPLGLLQAFSAGLPVVAARVGGIPEIVKHNATGFVSARGDHRMLVALLGLLVKDRTLRLTLGEKARETQRARFTERTMTRETERVYRAALGAGS